MSLREILGPEQFSEYNEWYDSVANDYTYEQWSPSEDYSELTLLICLEADTVVSLRTFTAVGNLRGFYEVLDAHDRELPCQLEQ